MDFEVVTRKITFMMRATLRAGSLYRRIFCADLVKDLTTDFDNTDNFSDIEKVFQLIYIFCYNKNFSMPDYHTWKDSLPAFPAGEVIRAIQGVWAAVSTPTIEPPEPEEDEEAEGRQRKTEEASFLFYQYLARKLKISFTDMGSMLPGELIDILYYDMRMQYNAENPEYLANQSDYEDFFNS